MGLLRIIVLLFLVLGGLPRWHHSREWGYAPSGLLGVALIVVLILVMLGHIPSNL